MSDLRPGAIPVEIAGQTYNLMFSLSVLDAIQDKYGSLAGMIKAMGFKSAEDAQQMAAQVERGEAVEETDLAAMRDAVCYVLAAMVNDDIDERNERGEALPPMTVKALKRRMRPSDFLALRDVLVDVIQAGMPQVEGDSKNGAATP